MAEAAGGAARVDREGRLLSADAQIGALQLAAGAAIGDPLAIPQLAALARSAQSLMVALSRPVIAGDESHDYEFWVRAEPDEDGVTLTIERAAERNPAPPRLDRSPRLDLEPEAAEGAQAGVALEWSVDANLAVTGLSEGLVSLLDVDDWDGMPLTRLFRLLETDDGILPLLAALAAREDFVGQPVEPRRGGDVLILSGTAILAADGRFCGFRGVARRPGGAVDPGDTAAVMIDEAIDVAMRSPLDLIIDAADRIVERSEGPLRSDYASYASDIASAGRHLLEVIRSMNAESGGGEAVDVVGSVLEAVALLRTGANRRGVAIEVDHPEQRLDVRGERRGIVQIIVNILGNAVRHSPDGGTVAVVFETLGSKVAITVADQGPGIPLTDQARIFERYEQSGPPEKAAEGTGLGLAISRRLARAMGGEVGMVSAPGEGARFTLTLDRA